MIRMSYLGPRLPKEVTHPDSIYVLNIENFFGLPEIEGR
jgi:hypothetical protein